VSVVDKNSIQMQGDFQDEIIEIAEKEWQIKENEIKLKD
jgi:hypothetical protein